MVKIRKKILAVLLTAAMLVSMSSVVAWSDEQPATDDGTSQTEQTTDDNASADDTKDDKSDDTKDDKKKLRTDEEGLADMSVIAENDNLKLYFDETTTNFAVQSKSDNYVWWATPLNADKDENAKTAQKKNMQAPLYVVYGDVSSHTSQRMNIYDASIKSDDFSVEQIENGVKVIYRLSKIEAEIPMTITLEKDNVNVSVITSEIKEQEATDTKGLVLLDIGLLQFFGAAGMEDEGYMVVPDGSGAVINYNNQRINAQAYSNDVYGRDTSIGVLTRPSKTEQVYLPVIGAVTNGEKSKHGFMAIAKSGETCASVNATVSGQNSTSYNNTWFEFKVRAEDTYYMGTRKLTVYEQGKINQPNLTVGYYPLSSENLSYVDIAEAYRNYLIEQKGFTDKNDNITNSYYLDLYGGTVKAQSIAGFPVNLETAATTYEQAQEIIKQLNDLGVDDIVANYNDFNGAGIKGMITADVNYAGTLGGKNAYKSLADYVNSVNAKLFASAGITYMKDSGNGYSYTLNACKAITKAYATTNNWDIAFGIPNQVRLVTKTTLSPYYWPDLYKKISTSFASEGIKTISIGDATTLLYSDYSRENYSRTDTMNILVDGYKQFKDAGFTLLASGANAYALPYVDYLTDVPVTSSNFDLFDYDIPFYEIVIHGYLPYTTKAVNASANANDTIMLALLTATPVHYDMMYADPNDFTDSDYETLFYSNYKGWLEPSAKVYKLYQDELKDFANLHITGYNRISGDEMETEFDGGKTIKVNTREMTLTVNGKDIDLAQYGLKGETDE
ncbi:MAG: DUF5696 domain-containing protein [Ruminiclostridium sp.]